MVGRIDRPVTGSVVIHHVAENDLDVDAHAGSEVNCLSRWCRYLYHRLYSGGLENGLYRTADGRDTILLHKEYPTVARYQRAMNGKLPVTSGGATRRMPR